MEEESKAYKECYLRISSLKAQLLNVHSLVRYFKLLRDADLYPLKLNLSSEVGLKRFHKKCRDHAAVIRKGVHEVFKKI